MFQQRRRRRCNDFDSNNPILSTACAGACVPGVFGLCRHPHSKKGIYLRRRFQRRLRIYLRCRRFAFSRKSPSGPGLFEDFFHWYVFKVSSFPRVKGVVLEGGSDVSCSHKKYVFFATTYENALRQKRVTLFDVSMRCLQNRKDDEDDDDSAFVVCVECECVRQWCVCVCVCVCVWLCSVVVKRTQNSLQNELSFVFKAARSF